MNHALTATDKRLVHSITTSSRVIKLSVHQTAEESKPAAGIWHRSNCCVTSRMNFISIFMETNERSLVECTSGVSEKKAKIKMW